jgi:hypothetical protein
MTLTDSSIILPDVDRLIDVYLLYFLGFAHVHYRHRVLSWSVKDITVSGDTVEAILWTLLLTPLGVTDTIGSQRYKYPL